MDQNTTVRAAREQYFRESGLSEAGYTARWVKLRLGPLPLAFPNTAAPNGVLSPFWDDLVVDGQAGVYTKTIGTGPNRQFVIEWRNVLFFNSVDRISFEVVFSETGPITYRYVGALDTAEKQGGGAYIGMENATGTAGFSYGAMQPLLVGGRAITFTPVP